MTALHAEQGSCLELLAVAFHMIGSEHPYQLMNIPRHAMSDMNVLVPLGLFQQSFLGHTRGMDIFKCAIACMGAYVSS